MQTKTITTYSFAELSDEAKETARSWWREHGLNYEWYDCTFDYAKEVGAVLGIDIDKIYFSGFWSQGDGASFTSSYHYKPGWRKALRKHARGDNRKELERIGMELQRAQRFASYQITASTHQHGHYMGGMVVDVELGDPPGGDGWPTLEGCPHLWEEPVKDALEDFAHWVYRTLEKEYEYLNSDEQVDEMLTINEYEFTAEGKVA
jgi:hypothetical protein